MLRKTHKIMQAPQPTPQQHAHQICGSIQDKIEILLHTYPSLNRASEI